MAVRRALTGPPSRDHLTRIGASVRDSDPYGLDLQLALCMCYELHYRGFAGVDPTWEWNPALLHLRAELEQRFPGRRAPRRRSHRIRTARRPPKWTRISVEPVDGTGPSYYLRDTGTWQQMREYFVHRSLYHLKEGDPHAWAIPRLMGGAKAAFVAVEFDEYGAGQGARLHQQLFADLLAAAGLDSTYLALPRRGPRRSAGSGEPDVAVRIAPPSCAAPRSGISRRRRSPRRRAPAGWSQALQRMDAPPSLRRVLPRARRGRRGARTGGAHRRGRGSRRPRTAAGPRHGVRDPRARRGRRPLGGHTSWRRWEQDRTSLRRPLA